MNNIINPKPAEVSIIAKDIIVITIMIIIRYISSKNIEGIEKVDGIVEKPQPAEAPSNLAVFGRYILSKDIFSNIEQTKPGLNNEIQLTDAIQELILNKDVFALEFEGRRYDCGSKEGYISAIIDRAMSIDKYKSIIEK